MWYVHRKKDKNDTSVSHWKETNQKEWINILKY